MLKHKSQTLNNLLGEVCTAKPLLLRTRPDGAFLSIITNEQLCASNDRKNSLAMARSRYAGFFIFRMPFVSPVATYCRVQNHLIPACVDWGPKVVCRDACRHRKPRTLRKAACGSTTECRPHHKKGEYRCYLRQLFPTQSSWH